MDHERDRLVAALRHKLTELDARVVAYRRDRADEFRRYAVDLLQPVTDDAVVAAVTQAIDGDAAVGDNGNDNDNNKLEHITGNKLAETYPALYPGFLIDAGGDDSSRSILSPPPASRAQPRRTASPPPVLYHTSGVPKEGPRRPPSPSLHARDSDDAFRGVFTPPFLPLLDSWSSDHRTERPNGVQTAAPATATPTSTSTLASTPTVPTGEEDTAMASRSQNRIHSNTSDSDAALAAAATSAASVASAFAAATAEAAEAAETKAAEVEAEAAAKAAAATPTPPPAPPSSEPKLKSALRRSSSVSSSRSSRSPTPSMNNSSNDPPPDTRHVRFSFGGEEVLPTSSPPRSDPEQDLSWLLHDHRTGLDAPASSSTDAYTYNENYQGATTASSGPAPSLSSTAAEAASLSPPLFPSLPGARTGTAAASSAAAVSAAGDSTPPSHGPGAQQGGGRETRMSDESQAQPASRGRGRGSVDTFPSSNSFSSSSSSHPPPLPPAPPPPPQQPRRRHSQILDDDEEEEFVPLSRKVSSSDKLRALSKMPLEDPSMWTVVNPQGDAAADSGGSVPTSAADLRPQPQPQKTQPAPSPPRVGEHKRIVGANKPTDNSEDSDDEDDDDEFIAMRSSQKKSAAPPVKATTLTTTTTTTTATNGNAPKSGGGERPKRSTSRKQAVQVQYAGNGPAEDDEFFDFEHDGDDDADGDAVGYPLARVTDVNTHFEDDGEDEDDDGDGEQVRIPDDDALVRKEKTALGIGTDGLDSDHLVFNRSKLASGEVADANLSPSSLSPPRSIIRAEQQQQQVPQSPSVGSYRGRPIDLFNVVKDPRVLQQATQMGTVSSFFGSIHDHEPHGPATMAEFSSLSGREQLNLLSGTPRSLTERMIMDDARAMFAASPSRHH